MVGVGGGGSEVFLGLKNEAEVMEHLQRQKRVNTEERADGK